MALPEEGRRKPCKAAEEVRRSAQKGAANALRTSNSKEQGMPPRRATISKREVFYFFAVCLRG